MQCIIVFIMVTNHVLCYLLVRHVVVIHIFAYGMTQGRLK